ncbi:DUF2141 domain-containing protein [Caulobacter vibrioides]|uniref:DUF2141 domain-containing protein n=2 Tax=Caulobacter vibrioides TaxID=155892 RepID=Q9AB99_CAUVC|nr:DUF2141 domain-containing protein [Caulobacter vibrioides]YP_002515710.1 conserved hypothetical protein [Caulobacter vibrioides NA1000]AAK22319.1 hypothetical protein CC_0332 [Caulobacter vibrioides CB15]ACL93802.1 conserved hypothetical protein [Caulobacter vibrioides NA1000]ATC27161.1 DUF2141 domain-containing protein [Caulobacter vibrioides]QXZ52424.1 DUF2141 domain-containing protein [Caulobacter vibrioides]
MTLVRTLALALAAASIIAPAARAQEALGDLTLTFPDLKAKQGQILIAVFDSPQGWASGKPVRFTNASAAKDPAAAKILALPPGSYAVRAFQDVDGDGKMATNPFGIPTEPYGFSRDAQPNMGPPSFAAAAFEVKAGANAQSLRLN